MSRECMLALAARHGLKAADLVEAWAERAAIRQYVGGFTRQGAELWAIGDVEQQYQIGLHDPESLRRWTAGGARKAPARSRGG